MKEERKTEGVNQYLKFSGMGMQMAITIALFTWLGTFLDKKFETDKPLWTAGLSLLGVFAGLYLMLKQLPKK
ncbi:AtpZ/AtpI family protein [Empedobacter sedimenti]|uniref:AtpZ/AtpI family protein n=1 Tax=Empedobacter sedimenti TaxID=3042610 RepID=UPI0024A77A4D|nr:AtpZ/AtpI family protein [Empedobacter sedimenti]